MGAGGAAGTVAGTTSSDGMVGSTTSSAASSGVTTATSTSAATSSGSTGNSNSSTTMGGTGGVATASTTDTNSSATTGAGGTAGTGGGVVIEANGYARNPIVSHIYTADPSADVYEGRIYVITSHDEDDQTGYDMIDYHIFSSDDLVNWQDHGVVLDLNEVTWLDFFYAPDICYHEPTNKYYLYFPDNGGRIGVAVSDTPGGPYQDALGGPLITRSTPGVEDVDWVFDPTCFIDDDGQAYLYFGGGPGGTGPNARVIRLNSDMVSLMDASASVIDAPDFFEASFMHKRDGKYYFSYSTSFDNHAAYIDYMMSDNPMTGFQYVGTVIPSPDGNNGDNNHHSFVEYQGQWYAFYHNRVLSIREGKSNYQRSITLDLLSYAADGTMNAVPATRGTVPQLKAGNATQRWEAETIADQRGIETDWAQDGAERVGVKVTDTQNGDWIGYSQLYFGEGATRFVARVASMAGGAGIELRLDGCDGFTEQPGTLLASCQVESTGNWNTWSDLSCDIPSTSGVHDLCLVFTGGSGRLVDVDYFYFQ